MPDSEVTFQVATSWEQKQKYIAYYSDFTHRSDNNEMALQFLPLINFNGLSLIMLFYFFDNS